MMSLDLAVMTNPDELYQWQEERKRQDALPGYPVGGFGPAGNLTLWIPTFEEKTTIEFSGGRPVRRAESSCADPELAAMRESVIRSLSFDSPAGVLAADMAFHEWAAAMVLRNYTLSDAELAQVLGAGTAWHQPAIENLLGGNAGLEHLRRLGGILPALVQGLAPFAMQPDEPAAASPAPTAPRRRPWRWRAAAWLKTLWR